MGWDVGVLGFGIKAVRMHSMHRSGSSFNQEYCRIALVNAQHALGLPYL